LASAFIGQPPQPPFERKEKKRGWLNRLISVLKPQLMDMQRCFAGDGHGPRLTLNGVGQQKEGGWGMGMRWLKHDKPIISSYRQLHGGPASVFECLGQQVSPTNKRLVTGGSQTRR
jgi:hypothetical protein